MLILIDILLIILCAAGMMAIYSFGFHRGVDTIARLELAEKFPEEYPLPAVVGQFVGERRDVVRRQAEENLFQIWRKSQGLPDNPTARAMYNDKAYRVLLEEQSHNVN